MFAVLPSSNIGPGSGYAANPPTAGRVSSSSSSWGFHQREATADIRRVTIFRDSLDTPWGFRLQGGKDFNTPLSVKRVFSGSPADGRLTRDDLILAINDQPVDDLLHADVLEKIKSAGSSIVLTIQTSALESQFGYASQDNFQAQGTSHRDKLYSPEETAKQYNSYQAASASSYDTSPTTYKTSPTAYKISPTTYEASPTTYGTSYTSHGREAANIYSPKITTHQSRHRSAKRFPVVATVPSGLSEPGWVPRPKSVSRDLPLTTHHQPLASPQYRSPQAPAGRQPAQYPAQRDFWKEESASEKESGGSAWYGSLRSTRAPHSWELRATKIQIPSEQESDSVRKEPEQEQLQQTQHLAQVQQVQPQQLESEPSRTFKAEIRGLRLARPSHTQTQSTPEWEDADEARLYRSHGHTRSAPETPVADTTVNSAVKNMTSGYQDIETSSVATYSQPTVESPAIKIQPSLLFGDRSGRVVQPTTAQSRIIVRAEPQVTNTTVSRAHTRHEVTQTAPKGTAQMVSAPKGTAQIVPAPKGTAQMVSAPTVVPVQQVVSAFQANPPIVSDVQATPTTPVKAPEADAHPSVQIPFKTSKGHPLIHEVPALPAKPTYLPETVERFNPVPDRPESKAPAVVKHLHPVPGKQTNLPKMPVERFNPVPDKPEKLPKMPVERFNPVPDKPEKLPKMPVECFNPVPDEPEKLPKMPVECFNPVPDKPEKLPKMPVERFNPVPDKAEKLPKMPVERFNPVPDRTEQMTKAQVKHSSVPQTLGQLSQKPEKYIHLEPDRPAKIPETPVERFNPVPYRSNESTQALEKQFIPTVGKFPKIPAECFNTVPDRPVRLQNKPVERFNPTPDRPNKA